MGKATGVKKLAIPRNVRLTPEQEVELAAIADENFSISTHIRLAVDEYLKKFRKKEK
jgi:hypothetical protein